MDLQLTGKVALVTGAGSQIGFGRAISLTLAKEGCNVIVNDINLEDAEKTATAVKALGQKSLAIEADITSKSAIRKMIDQSLQQFNKIDILINNAGAVTLSGPFPEQDESIWQKEINLNLIGTMLCCQAVLPSMTKHKYGKIINISSGTAKIVHPAVSAYSIAKGGVIIFTRSLAKTVISSGITVNCIAPGWSLTNFIKGDTEALKARFLPETPLGRGTEPQDIANTVAFLVSDVSADIVGQVISVDGGSTMQ